MPKTNTKTKTIPAFESEEEELLFWDTHDPEEYFEETPIGTLQHEARPLAARATTVSLDARLASAVRKAAAEANTDLDTFARQLLRQGLLAARSAAQVAGGAQAKELRPRSKAKPTREVKSTP